MVKKQLSFLLNCVAGLRTTQPHFNFLALTKIYIFISCKGAKHIRGRGTGSRWCCILIVIHILIWYIRPCVSWCLCLIYKLKIGEPLILRVVCVTEITVTVTSFVTSLCIQFMYMLQRLFPLSLKYPEVPAYRNISN